MRDFRHRLHHPFRPTANDLLRNGPSSPRLRRGVEHELIVQFHSAPRRSRGLAARAVANHRMRFVQYLPQHVRYETVMAQRAVVGAQVRLQSEPAEIVEPRKELGISRTVTKRHLFWP